MKRSRTIRLVLLGSAGIVTLTACEDPNEIATKGRFFTDAQACESAYDRQECLDAYQRAHAEHAETAPKFASRAECEAEFGAENCAQTPRETAQASAGGSWFMPMMMGYMMGRMAGGGLAAAPIYRDTQNTAYSGNRTVGRLDAARMPPPRAVAGTAGVPRQAVARGGFGRAGYGAAS